jgi:hypothetical protein
MSTDPGRSPDDKLDDFLDRLLGPEDEAAMTRKVEADQALANEAALQDHIDAELKDMYRYDESRAPVFGSEAEAPAPIAFPTKNPFASGGAWPSLPPSSWSASAPALPSARAETNSSFHPIRSSPKSCPAASHQTSYAPSRSSPPRQKSASARRS